MRSRVWILLATVLVVIIVVSSLPPIPQSQAYHDLADMRLLWGVPNCLNVISNVLFLFVGLWGLRFVWASDERTHFINLRERWPWLAFFAGVALTSLGSAYYHLNPNDRTLLWDRIPMTIAFMALVSAMVAERISEIAGLRLLLPLLVLGSASVIYWSVTQAHGHGDLRPYGMVQFGSLLVVLLVVVLFPARYTRGSDLVVSFSIYALAKIFEAADRPIFASGGIVSGHTLKHISAALSAWWILRMLRFRAVIRSPRAWSGSVVPLNE